MFILNALICKGKIKNYHKSIVLKEDKLKWIPENLYAKPGYESYKLQAFYAPIGNITWEEIAQQWVDAQDDPEKIRTFVNFILAEPYDEKGEAPETHEVKAIKKRL